MHKALCDLINTCTAPAVISTLITGTNTYLKYNQKTAGNPATYFSLGLVREVCRWITQTLEIFGLANPSSNDAVGWSSSEHSSDLLAPGTDLEGAILQYIRVLLRPAGASCSEGGKGEVAA
jgi:cysteinyl-tRNA synthetase